MKYATREYHLKEIKGHLFYCKLCIVCLRCLVLIVIFILSYYITMTKTYMLAMLLLLTLYFVPSMYFLVNIDVLVFFFYTQQHTHDDFHRSIFWHIYSPLYNGILDDLCKNCGPFYILLVILLMYCSTGGDGFVKPKCFSYF